MLIAPGGNSDDDEEEGEDSDEEGDQGSGVVTLADVKAATQAWAMLAGVGMRLGASL
jgi:hypothetical protein